MSSLSTAYTPLESFLLFQSLASYGVETHAFTKVSDLLQGNSSVRDAPTYNPARLSPDALRELYLGLLKEEARDELHKANDAEPQPHQNGDSPSSRKRKAPSPHLPTVQEAAEHAHLIPQLISKLYTRYRRHAIDEIRQEEQRYDKLSRELQEIQRGDWDERFRHELEVNGEKEGAQSSPPAAAPPAATAEVSPQDAQGPVRLPTPLPEKAQPTSEAQSPTTSQPTPEHRRSSTKIEALINPPSGTPNGAASPRKTSAPSPTQPPPPTSGAPSHHRTSSQPLQPNVGLPPPQPSQHGYRLSSPYAPSHTASAPGPSQSPTSQNVPITSRPPANPVVLPPPPGIHIPPPPVQVPSMPENNGQFRPPSGSPHHSPHQYAPRPFPPGAQSPATHHHPPQMQPPPGFYQPYPGQPYPAQQPAPQMYYPPRQPGGIMLAPFQVSPQDPVRAHQEQQRAMQQQQQQQQQAAHHPPSRTAPSPRTSVATPVRPSPYVQTPGPQPSLPPPAAVATPRAALKTPRQLSLKIATPLGSWKKSLPQPNYPPPPEWNPTPVSPISPPASPVLSKVPETAKKSSKRPIKSKEMPAPDADTCPGRSTTRKATGKRARAASTASSAVTGSVRGRTRSQSVVSHAEEPVLGVKAEPSTPAEIVESDVQSTTDATPSSGRRTRRRAGTLQSVLEQPATTGNKRKRDGREESETVDDVDMSMVSPGPPSTIIAAKNFAKMSVPVMNDINSHKHASLFANPVKAKDAEGYYDIIRRPQDLKSIRTAIGNGTKAVAAATASTADTPSAASPGQQPHTPTPVPASTHITLPISEDLLPPKSIVNSAQLERELMRMFANAVMFNSGDDGVVGDAVEMAKDVEAIVANWRAAEPRSEIRDADDGDDRGGYRKRF